MQIILLEKVANLGNLGDVVKVKDGYARNYLIPGKLARRATEAAIKEFEGRRAELENAAAAKLTAAQSLGEFLDRGFGRAARELGRDQVVAREAVLDLDDLAEIAEVEHFVEQNDLHAVLP